MKTLSRLSSKESALTILVVVSQIFAVNDRVIAQSIPQISIPGLAAPVIPVITPNVAIPTVNVTTRNNIPATSLRSQPVIPTVNVTTTNNIPATSLRSQPVIPKAITPTFNVTPTTNNIPATSLRSQPIIPTVNVIINSPTPVIPTVNVTFDDKGVPTTVLKPLTFSVTGNQGNTEPSFLSVINNEGVNTTVTEVGSTNIGEIVIPAPIAPNGTVSTINVVFPSSQRATVTGISSTGNSSSFNLQVNFTPPVLD